LSTASSKIDDRADHLPEPIVVIEIISRSTERVDRGRKKIAYFATPSIRQYAIVEQDERLIDLYTRTEAG
jgi:Uma2 family endonuclease